MVTSSLQQKIDELLLDIKAVIQICEDNNLTNEQWFINFEDELNKLSGMDYSETPVILPYDSSDLTAEERVEKWLNYRNMGIQLVPSH